MPERRLPATDLTTEKAIKHLFPAEAEEAVRLEPKQARTPAGGADRGVKAGAQRRAAGAKTSALRRLRDAPDAELAVFEDRLRQNALAAGATEQELRDAQLGHPGHG